MSMFTVDTKLFQELGELLVAKESTALVELIKNAYDADATLVKVHASALDDVVAGSIVVQDDGVGMSVEGFQSGFLRIAGRAKLTADRRSPVFGRRYTGEKGIGRLATHKLATRLQVISLEAGRTGRGAAALASAIGELRATIDWTAIEALTTLDEVPSSNAIVVAHKSLSPATKRPSGTTLTMAPLRRPWSRRMLDAFLNEAVTLTPSAPVWDHLPDQILAAPLLFDRMPVRDQSSNDPGFHIQFSGMLASADTIIPDAAASASWIAEVDFVRETGVLRIALAPTKQAVQRYPTAKAFRFQKSFAPGTAPSFSARILQRSESTWPAAVQGIRIFMEGFRIAPYGDPTDDWLGLDRSYRARAHRKLSSLDSLDIPRLPEGLEIEELALQPPPAYMGAVFLHRSTSPELEMLANREGFLPGPGFEFIAQWVRTTTDLIVRLGYASRRPIKQRQREEREAQSQWAAKADASEPPTSIRIRERAQEAARQMAIVRKSISVGRWKDAANAAKAAQPHLDDISSLSQEFAGEAILWRVLASLGTELAAFIHEINSIALDADEIVVALDHAIAKSVAAGKASPLARARKSALALADRVRRNAAYLVDSTSFRGRRRRSRLPLRDRLEVVLPFFESRLTRKRIQLANDVPDDLRTPPMFPAELSGIFTNLLSNAVKFCEDNGRIRVTARETSAALQVTVQNTGTSVDLNSSAQLFEAFHSTTQQVDAVLGQGMGMGLTITRAFVEEYGGEIEFIPPNRGFATAIRFSIPLR